MIIMLYLLNAQSLRFRGKPQNYYKMYQNTENIILNRLEWTSPLQSLHEKWSFPWSISPVNVSKSAVSCGFDRIY